MADNVLDSLWESLAVTRNVDLDQTVLDLMAFDLLDVLPDQLCLLDELILVKFLLVTLCYCT